MPQHVRDAAGAEAHQPGHHGGEVPAAPDGTAGSLGGRAGKGTPETTAESETEEGERGKGESKGQQAKVKSSEKFKKISFNTFPVGCLCMYSQNLINHSIFVKSKNNLGLV